MAMVQKNKGKVHLKLDYRELYEYVAAYTVHTNIYTEKMRE